jgi:hypothetical protein
MGMIAGAIAGGSIISGMGASRAAKKSAKQQKRMMRALQAEAKRYREGPNSYANQNKRFYAGLAKESKGNYQKLGKTIEGDYDVLSRTITGSYDKQIANTRKDYNFAGGLAYHSYYDSTAKDLRETGGAGISRLLSSPDAVRSDAAYQFLQGEASRETARQAGARGYGVSGNVLTALQERRMNVADTYLNSILERYATSYGLGETARTQGLGAQQQFVSQGLDAATQLRGQSLDWQGRTRSAGVNALSQFNAMGEQSYQSGMTMSQQSYQQMLDNASNLVAGQGAIAVNNSIAASSGAAAGALAMSLGQGLTSAGSMYGMTKMYGMDNKFDPQTGKPVY